MDAGYPGQICNFFLIKMEWTLIRIIDRVRWWERCRWIETNSSWYQDHTNWALWQIGQADIEFYVPERDAILYYLTWT